MNILVVSEDKLIIKIKKKETKLKLWMFEDAEHYGIYFERENGPGSVWLSICVIVRS